MDPAHLHLILNHLPVVGSAFTLALLLVAFAKKSEELKRISLAFFVAVALLTVPVYLTGEPAEMSIMMLDGVEESFIEHHQSAAQWAFGAQIALGVLALTGFFLTRKGRPLPRWCARAVLVLSVVVCGLMARTANLGGQIRHPEIRPAQAPASPTDKEKTH